MAGYERGQKRFNFRGLDLNNPVDHCAEDAYPFFKNVRSYVSGTIQSRVGITALYNVSAAQTPCRNFRRLNGVNSSQWVRVIKAGTKIAVERSGAAGSTSDVVTGLSSNPVALVPYRPEQSVDAWMIYSDSAKMGKIKEDGVTVHQLGLDAPCAGNAAGMALPAPAIDQPQAKEIDFIEYANNGALQAAWAQTGTAGLPVLTPSKRINTTVNAVLFDAGATGWACIQPVGTGAQGLADLTVGSVVKIAAETGIVVAAIRRGDGSTNYGVTSIVYDSAVPGLASIQIATPTTDIQPDSMLQFSDAFGISLEYVRVLSVTPGKDGRCSIRVKTTQNWSGAGVLDHLIALPSFRAYLTAGGHTVGDAIVSEGMETVTTGAGTGELTRTVTLDLSQIATGLPLRDEDLMCASMRVTPMSALQTIRFECDIDAVAGNRDFKHNALIKEIRASDLTQALLGTASILDTQQTVQRNVIIDSHRGVKEASRIRPGDDSLRPSERRDLLEPPDTPGTSPTDPEDTSSSDQTGTGENQWCTIQWRVGEMARVGTDFSRSLRNVAKIRVVITSTAVVTVDVDSWFVRGGYNPDTRDALLPYSYACVARCSSTGVTSALSPASRVSVFPERQRVKVTLAQYTAAAEVDKLDVYRFGGLTLGWHYVGTVANGATPVFTDDYSDAIISQNAGPPDSLRPWATISTPVSGTATTVAGTSVKTSGLSTLWAPGTEIVLGGVPNVITRVISSGGSGVMELQNAADQNAGLTWEIQEPVLLGQPMPIFAEHTTPEGARTYFGAGDPLNPGRLYYSIGNIADGHRIFNYADLTSGSEPIVAIVSYNGQPVAFTSMRAFAIRQKEDGYSGQELPVGHGLFSRWAIATGDLIYFLAADGIYATAGGEAKNITVDRLGPLFPNQKEGTAGVDTNGVSAPAMTAANAAEMRLNLCGNGRWLFFDYVDGSSNRRTLACDLQTGVWHYDIYTPGAVFHADEESPGALHNISMVVGGADAVTAKLYTVGGNDDAGTPIACQVRTPSMDVGDPRMRKRFGDMSVEINAAGATVSVTPGFDEHAVTLASTNLPTTTGRVQTTIDFNAGEGQRGKNISLDLAWSATTGALPILYFWEPSWLNRPVGTLRRATDYDDKGRPICKWVQGIWLEADTFGVTRSAVLRGDEGVVITTITPINHAGKSIKYYSVNPVYTHELSLLGGDASEWDLYEFYEDAEPGPSLSITAGGFKSQPVTHGLTGYQQLLDGYLAVASAGSITLNVYVDGSAVPVVAVFPNESTNTAGAKKKMYFRLPATKGRTFVYELVCASGFRLFDRDCEVRVRSWGGGEGFRSANPFLQQEQPYGA